MNPRTRIAVVDYGVGNLRSAHKAFEHLGVDARLTSSAADIVAADGVVVPGVGAFEGCVRALETSGLTDVVTDLACAARDVRGVPFLGICVGLQLLFEGSDESPDAPGLAVLPGVVQPLEPGVKTPQMQWNRLSVTDPTHPLLMGIGTQPWMYFVHGYRAPDSPNILASCDYGGTVCAAIGTGALVATQFHPEKSGSCGLALLGNFARMCADRK